MNSKTNSNQNNIYIYIYNEMNSMKLCNIQEQINTNNAIQRISLQLQKPNKYFKKMKFKEFNSSQNNQT